MTQRINEQSTGTGIHRTFLVNTIPLLLYGIEKLACHAASISMDIPWGFFQLLDRQELLSHPFWSLFFLHSQPPLLNGLLALILNLSVLTGVTPSFWANILYTLIGAAISCGLFRLTLKLTASIGWAVLATILLLADPGTHLFQHQYFYPFILQVLLIGMALFSLRFLKQGRVYDFMMTIILITLICNTGSLYHPLWGILMAGMLVAANRINKGRTMPPWVLWTGLATLVIGLTVWPLKNLAVFNQFTFSTWKGVNLARGTDCMKKLADGKWRLDSQDGINQLQSRFTKAPLNVVASPEKSDGSLNWNQYGFVVINPMLSSDALRWRLDHPGAWAKMAATHYAIWTSPSYADSYLGGVRVPGNEEYRNYARFHLAIFHPDLRPMAERLSKCKLFGISRFTGEPIPLTLLGLVIFPLIMIGTWATNWKPAFRDANATAIVCLLMSFCILWVLAIPCLTDGHEGNRMRFAVDPFIVALGIKLANDGWRRWCTPKPG